MGATFYGDINNASNPGLQVCSTNPCTFTAFTTADTITGNPDPALYKTGRQGTTGYWIINVPNGNYNVTLGVAPNSSYNTGQCGQDQTINSTTVANAVWNPTNVCGTPSGAPPPATDTVGTLTYSVSAFSQQIEVQVAASFGGGRTTLLNTVEIAQVGNGSPPAAPTGVSATGVSGAVNLSWTASSGTTYYVIMRALSTGGFYTPAGISSTTTYTDSAVTNGITYYYYLEAVNGGGPSGYSSQVSAVPNTPAPGIPTGLGATPGNQSVSLSWTAPTANTDGSPVTLSGYTIYYGTSASALTESVVISGASNTSYEVSGLASGTWYFAVAADAADGQVSAPSLVGSKTL